MQNLVELLKDHALLLAAGNSLSAIARADEPRPEAAFDALRRLARQLEQHLRAEDEFLVQDREHGRQEFATLAAEHGERFDDLVQEWGTYLREWTEENIRCDWPSFRKATGWIVERLNEQVEAENAALYPSALRYGIIRLLPETERAPAH